VSPRAFVAALTVGLAVAADARAAEPEPPAPAAQTAPPAPASASGVAAAAAPAGLVVLAEGAGTEDAARRLAYALYRSKLRPAAVDERVARTLVGETPPAEASTDVLELAELRAGVHGDDAASRQLLVAVARRTGARGVLVVREGPRARPFDASTATFEPVTLQPDPDGGWASAVAWLDRGAGGAAGAGGAGEGAASRRAPPPALATSEVPRTESRPFYTSPWLWAGVAGAVALGALFFLAASGGDEPGVPLRLDVAR
jgi:hypothetical protein